MEWLGLLSWLGPNLKNYSTANKGQSTATYHQKVTFDIDHAMIIVTVGFSKKSFFINITHIS